jgi:hypothetical protein
MSNKPKRIQRRRTKGYKMPKGAVYVGRPTKWGNPHRVVKDGQPSFRLAQMIAGFSQTLPEALQKFEGDLLAGNLKATVKDVQRELRGKDLACWCPVNSPCHADILLKYANEGESCE